MMNTNFRLRLVRAAACSAGARAHRLGLVLTGLALALASPVVADAQTTTRSSVSTGGGQAGGDSGGAAVSADGRYVAFQSWASNLVAGDSNGLWAVFVHDRVTNSTARVSVGPGGAQATGGLTGKVSPAISADGRYVAFESDAANLVAGDTGTARVTVVVEGGGLVTRDVALPANSRTNVPVIESWFPGVTGKRFGAIIESLGGTPAQIVVERAMYSDASGVHWAAGTNATATRLTP